MTKTEIESLLADLGVPFATVANVLTGQKAQFGDATSIDAADLNKALFQDAEAVAALGPSLEGQPYRSWSQGDVACVVCNVAEDTVIGLFVKRLAPVEQYHRTKQLCEKVKSSWR